MKRMLLFGGECGIIKSKGFLVEFAFEKNRVFLLHRQVKNNKMGGCLLL